MVAPVIGKLDRGSLMPLAEVSDIVPGLSTRLLYVGTFPSLRTTSHSRAYCEDLSDRLQATFPIIRTSPHLRRVLRLADVIYTTYARRDDYDIAIVDVFSGLAFSLTEAVCFALDRLGKPYVLTLHGGALPEFSARWPRRVRRVLAAARLVTAPSRYLAERMRSLRDDILVIPNASEVESTPFRIRTTIRPHLVWVRAFHEIYNPMLAIDTIAALTREFPSATLTMVGPDKDGSLATVRRHATEVGVADRVRFVGAVAHEKVAAFLAEADVFINTTNIDNTPLSVIEAAANGLCIVSTRVGGVPYLVEDGRDALLVPPADPKAMTSAVSRLLADPGLCERLSRGARELAVRHDWSNVLAQWSDRLTRLVPVAR